MAPAVASMPSESLLGDMLGHVWSSVGAELSLLVFFALGFVLFRSDRIPTAWASLQEKRRAAKKEVELNAAFAESAANGTVDVTPQTEAEVPVAEKAVEVKETPVLGALPSFPPRPAPTAHSDAPDDIFGYMSLFRQCGREKNAGKALDLLQSLEQSSSAQVDVTAMNSVLDVCVTSGAYQQAEELFTRMKTLRLVDTVSYNTTFKLLAATNACGDEVMSALCDMKKRGCAPNQVTYNTIMNVLVSSGDLHSAWRCLEQMETEGVKVDSFTCSTMLKALKHTPKAEDVNRILQLANQAGVQPDEVLVNTVLDCCLRLRDPARLTAVLTRFKAQHAPLSLHARGVAIRTYGLCRRLDLAWKVWEELVGEREMAAMRLEACVPGEEEKAAKMRSHLTSLKPTEALYGSLVEACVAAGALEEASTVFQQMKEEMPTGTRSANVFVSLIKGFAQRKDTERALEVYNQMCAEGVVCSVVTYNTLLDSCTRSGDLMNAARVFEGMQEMGVAPDLISFSTLIKGYCVHGDLEQGLLLFSFMRRRGIQPDAILFNSILDGCAKKQMRTLTEQVLGDMEECNVPPSNFTLSILVKLYGRCRDLAKAFELVDSLPRKYNFEVNTQVFTCLMSACITHGHLDRALEVFDQMLNSRCAQPDSKSYSTLAAGCLKFNNLEEAAACLYKAMGVSPKTQSPVTPRRHAVTLDAEVIESVLFMIGRRKMTDRLGSPLLKCLQEVGHYRPSERMKDALQKGSVSGASLPLPAAPRTLLLPKQQ